MGKVRIGILGLGFGMEYMARVMKSARGNSLMEVHAVCDANPARLSGGQKTFGCPGFADLDQMLVGSKLDAVAIFSGPVGRAELVRKIIRSGKHVMTTKPFELDPEASRDVLEEARRLGIAVHLNSPAATVPPDIQQIFDWRRTHHLGRPVAAHWQSWCNYRENPDGSWYDDPLLCPAAPIFRLGIYAINDLLYFFDEPLEVYVMHSRIFTARPTPDQALLSIRFKDGSLAGIFASFCVDNGLPYSDRLALNFERGAVFRNSSARASRNRIDLTLTATGEDGKPVFAEAKGFDPEQSGGHFSYQWELFCQAVRGEPAPDTVSPKQIVDGIRIIAAMSRSERSGKPELV